MGANLYAGDESTRDVYNQYGLMSVLSGTLEGGSMARYSWWKLCDEYATANATTGIRESNKEQLKAFIELLEGALIELSQTRTWYYGYDSGAPLASYEKDQYCKKLIELISFLQYALHRNTTLQWSV